MLLDVLLLIALPANAMTAALAAGRRNMDWVGVCLLACVTALGGGSCRDVLLGHYPLTWVQNPYYLLICIVAALATIAAARWIHFLRITFLVLDAIGLVAYSIIGCDIAMSLGLSPWIAIIAGMITGCAGGVFRDILCNDVPLLFRGELYASVSVVTGALYLGGQALLLPHEAVVIGAMAAGLALRLAAIRFNWEMPRFVYTRDLH